MSYYLPVKPNPLNLDVKEPAWKSLIQKLDMVSYHCSMPVLENVQVSLNEILEVRGDSLEEWELWGVLFQTTEAVQDIFLRGHACKDGIPQYLVTPDNLFCTSMGRIILNVCLPESITGTKYWCSEMANKECYLNISNLEKIYVYTIGQTMLHAAYYGVHEKYQKKLSPLFKTVLQAMCQNDMDLRMVLSDVSEVCCFHAYKHMKGCTFLKSVVSLHREVLGSLPENEILTQVDQDVMQENETKEVECEVDDPFDVVNYDAKHFSYGHRLGYHPELSRTGKTEKIAKITPKERWKKAYNKIVDEIRKSKMPMLDKEKMMENWKKHKAHQTIFRVYEELTERRKMLELLRLSINIGPSAPVDVDKNPLLMTGLKPKTIAELVLLLQRPPKQPAITNPSSSSDNPGCSSDSLNSPPKLPHSFGEGSHEYPYYALHKVVSKIPLKISDIDSLPGPQFIIGQLKPRTRISLFPGDSLEYQSSILNVSVILLTGEIINIECLHSTSGKQLFQTIANHIKLQERYLFGLASEAGGEYIFIERKQKLGEFLQSCITSPPVPSFQMLFRVKFYLDDVHLMRTQVLRHLFYLQLRKDFLSDDFCPDIKFSLSLGGLALQAEFGDYDSSIYGPEYFLLEHYLPFQCIKQLNRFDAKTKLQSHHVNLRGISKELAELKFIENMMQLAEYGCHFHKVFQDKKNLSSAVWLGIKPKGIEVYEIVSGKRSASQTYPWQSILRISFSKKCFCLVPRTESIMRKHVVYRFYTTVLHRSLYLFNIAMAHHKFFLKLKSVTKASEIFFEDFDSENFYVINKSEKEFGCDLYDSEGNLQLKAPKIIKHRSGSTSSLKKANFADLTNLQMFKNLLPCIEDVIILSSKGSGRIKRKKKYPNIIARSSSDPVKKDHSYFSSRIFSSKDLSSCITNTFNNDSKKPDLKFVRLHKDPKLGLGMVITCGDSYETILHGAFVESVHPGSPADLNGNIKPGDQIMSVNGTNVQNDYFLSVVDLIQCSNSPVDLVVAKTGKPPDTPIYPPKEIIEKPCIKAKAWILGDEELNSPKKIEDTLHAAEMPVPKPRKKLTQRKSSEGLQLDGPDLTLNHTKQSTGNKSWNNEPDSNVINEHLNSTNWSIPDIIASQMKCVGSHEFANMQKFCDGQVESSEDVSITDIDKNDLLPGEIYHVVLDKKGGSLGLNIFQGTETTSSLQKHIYIHSIIPNGGAELDGRIKPGDKLLEVNGILLEDLSYQEVVTTLRESPQVTHLVLEKGAGFSNKPEQDHSQSNLSLQFKTDLLVSKENESKSDVQTSSQSSFSNNKSSTHSKLHKAIDSVDSLGVSDNTYESYHTDDGNTFSSLPTSIESSLNCAKETSSAPSSYQHRDNIKSKGKSSPSENNLNVNKTNDSFSSPTYAKDENRFQNGLTSYKSTPNLADSSDEEDNRSPSNLYRNRSTDCLLYSPHFMNPHQALFDLYQNYAYVRGSSCNIHQIPAVPIRKKKLKKLEDIYNYCNIENTFVVTIHKSSRGLGLSISGGRDASRKDPFSQLIQIRKLYPLQPALECGKLALGDVILEVNGISMLGLTNTEALEVLRSAPKDVVLKVFRPSKSLIPSFSVFKGGIWPGFNSSSSSASSSLSRTENNSYNVETGEFEVTLMKRDGSLGFTISRNENGKEISEGIYVKALVREHAVSDGRIQPGDKILQVNGTDVSSLSHSEALAILRSTPDKVTLKLYRDDPPLSPSILDDDYAVPKPLRWEAVELLNDRVKQKDLNDESNTLKRKLKRRLDRSSNAPSNSSTESASSSSSSGQEHAIDENEMLASLADELSLEGVGLHRNQRPKSLDVLNSSDRKRFIGHSDEDSFHRQSSVMCPNVESKTKVDSDENGNNPAKKGKNLLKWRGSTLHDSEESSSIDTIQENAVLPSKDSNVERQMSSENKSSDDDDYKPVPFPRSTSCSSEWVNTFDVSIDRGWHLRLGFSVSDPPEATEDIPKNASLPCAAEVKAVYPGSLADKDGRIKVGDRIVEVNGESLLGKTAHEVIDILRKTRGVIRMVFCRLEKRS